MAGTPTLDQLSFAWVNDDGNEAGSTFYTGTNLKKRLRFELECTGENWVGGFELWASYEGGAYSKVTTTSSYVRSTTSTNVTDGTNTTDRMTTSISTIDLDGQIDTDGAHASITISKNRHAEVEWVLEFINADLNNTDTLDFRVYQTGGTTISSYTRTAGMTASITAGPFTASAAITTGGVSTSAVASSIFTKTQPTSFGLLTRTYGDFTKAIDTSREATATVTTGGVTCSASGTVSNLEYIATASPTIGGVTASATSHFIPAGTLATFVGQGDYTASSTAGTTPTLPSVRDIGDILIIVSRRWAGTPSTPSGWNYLGGGIDYGRQQTHWLALDVRLFTL
jgi:hypothetical protein